MAIKVEWTDIPGDHASEEGSPLFADRRPLIFNGDTLHVGGLNMSHEDLMNAHELPSWEVPMGVWFPHGSQHGGVGGQGFAKGYHDWFQGNLKPETEREIAQYLNSTASEPSSAWDFGSEAHSGSSKAIRGATQGDTIAESWQGLRTAENGSHQLGWTEGNTGKGYVTNEGVVHTWNTNDEGRPHHPEYMIGIPLQGEQLDRVYRQNRILTHPFTIGPGGEYQWVFDQAPGKDAPPIRPEDVNPIHAPMFRDTDRIWSFGGIEDGDSRQHDDPMAHPSKGYSVQCSNCGEGCNPTDIKGPFLCMRCRHNRDHGPVQISNDTAYLSATQFQTPPGLEPYVEGQPGKGLLMKDGTRYAWATNRFGDGDPTHSVAMQALGITDGVLANNVKSYMTRYDNGWGDWPKLDNYEEWEPKAAPGSPPEDSMEAWHFGGGWGIPWTAQIHEDAVGPLEGDYLTQDSRPILYDNNNKIVHIGPEDRYHADLYKKLAIPTLPGGHQGRATTTDHRVFSYDNTDPEALEVAARALNEHEGHNQWQAEGVEPTTDAFNFSKVANGWTVTKSDFDPSQTFYPRDMGFPNRMDQNVVVANPASREIIVGPPGAHHGDLIHHHGLDFETISNLPRDEREHYEPVEDNQFQWTKDEGPYNFGDLLHYGWIQDGGYGHVGPRLPGVTDALHAHGLLQNPDGSKHHEVGNNPAHWYQDYKPDSWNFGKTAGVRYRPIIKLPNGQIVKGLDHHENHYDLLRDGLLSEDQFSNSLHGVEIKPGQIDAGEHHWYYDRYPNDETEAWDFGAEHPNVEPSDFTLGEGMLNNLARVATYTVGRGMRTAPPEANRPAVNPREKRADNGRAFQDWHWTDEARGTTRQEHEGNSSTQAGEGRADGGNAERVREVWTGESSRDTDTLTHSPEPATFTSSNLTPHDAPQSPIPSNKAHTPLDQPPAQPDSGAYERGNIKPLTSSLASFLASLTPSDDSRGVDQGLDIAGRENGSIPFIGIPGSSRVLTHTNVGHNAGYGDALSMDTERWAQARGYVSDNRPSHKRMVRSQSIREAIDLSDTTPPRPYHNAKGPEGTPAENRQVPAEKSAEFLPAEISEWKFSGDDDYWRDIDPSEITVSHGTQGAGTVPLGHRPLMYDVGKKHVYVGAPGAVHNDLHNEFIHNFQPSEHAWSDGPAAHIEHGVLTPENKIRWYGSFPGDDGWHSYYNHSDAIDAALGAEYGADDDPGACPTCKGSGADYEASGGYYHDAQGRCKDCEGTGRIRGDQSAWNFSKIAMPWDQNNVWTNGPSAEPTEDTRWYYHGSPVRNRDSIQRNGIQAPNSGGLEWDQWYGEDAYPPREHDPDHPWADSDLDLEIYAGDDPATAHGFMEGTPHDVWKFQAPEMNHHDRMEYGNAYSMQGFDVPPHRVFPHMLWEDNPANPDRHSSWKLGAEWLLQEPEKAARGWTLGNPGKGLYDPKNDQLHTWNVDELGSPHHYEMGYQNHHIPLDIDSDGEFNMQAGLDDPTKPDHGEAIMRHHPDLISVDDWQWARENPVWDFGKTAGKLEWLESRPDKFRDTEEGALLFSILKEKFHNDKTDPLFPWLWKEARKGNIGYIDRNHLYFQDGQGGTDIVDGGKLGHMADWFSDKRNPTRQGVDLMGLDTGAMLAKMREYDEHLSNRDYEDRANGGKILKTLSNGWTVRELEPKDLDFEGGEMGHCVGGDGYRNAVEQGDTKIISLRDPKGLPHATMELDSERRYSTDPHKWTIEQIQGKSNEIPKPEYQAMLKEWITSLPEHERPAWKTSQDPITEIGEITGEDAGRYGEDGWGGYQPHGDYGIHTPPRPTDYEEVLEGIHNQNRSWRGDGEYDPAHGEALYEHALKRKEIPELAKAHEEYQSKAWDKLNEAEEYNHDFLQYPGDYDEDPQRWDEMAEEEGKGETGRSLHEHAYENYIEARDELAEQIPQYQAAGHIGNMLAPHWNAAVGGFTNEKGGTFSSWSLG